MWYQKLQSVLLQMGFTCVQVDSSIYVYNKEKLWIILPVFVDDITLASNLLEAIHSVIKQLSTHFRL